MQAKHRLGIVCGLWLFGCSGEAPTSGALVPVSIPIEAPPPVAKTVPGPSAEPAAPAPKRFTGSFATDATVALTEAGAPVGSEVIDTKLRGAEADALACLTGGEGATGQVWFVARIASNGALEELQTPVSDATPEQTKCLNTVVSKVVATPPTSPLAVSFRLRFSEASLPLAQQGGSVSGMSATESAVLGNMWGEPIGDSFGAGGLGLNGIGEGGGRGEGIGLGSIGTLGRGGGSGQGFGNGHGRLGSHTNKKPPSIKMSKTAVSGPLPPEVIQRIVRQNFGRFRLCYENGLRNKPTLAGRIEIDFTIKTDGSVSDIKSGKSTDMPDAGVVSCVQRSFGALSFPQPEGGVVIVKYPILFTPGDTPAQKAKPTPHKAFTIRTKKKVGDVDAFTIVSLLEPTHPGSIAVTSDSDHSIEHQKGLPFAVFLKVGDDVYVARRLRSNAKGFEPVSTGVERIGFDNWSMRVEGAETGTSQALLASLIDP